MAKKFLKRFLPHPEKIKKNPHLKIFGKWLHDPNLWHLTRHSVTKAVAIGLFVSFIPLPGHMLTAAFLAIFLHANLPLSVALVWVSNPFTIPPMLYLGYRVGIAVLHRPAGHFHFEPTLTWLMQEINTVGVPLLVGCLICGTLLSLTGSITIRLIWRYATVKAWRARKFKEKKIGTMGVSRK